MNILGTLLNWFMYIGCLHVGHVFNFRVSIPDDKGGWKDYYSCAMCGKRKPVKNRHK